MKKFKIAKITLFVSMLGMIGLQLYWMVKHYNDVADNFLNEILCLESLACIQVERELLKDSIPYKVSVDPSYSNPNGETYVEDLWSEDDDFKPKVMVAKEITDPIYTRIDSIITAKLGDIDKGSFVLTRHCSKKDIPDLNAPYSAFQNDLFGNTSFIKLNVYNQSFLQKTAGFTITTFVLLLLLIVSSYYILNRFKKQKQLQTLKDDFVSNISHELKTPITTMGIALEALEDFSSLPEETIQRYVELSTKENQRLEVLVDRIMTSCIIHSNTMIFSKERTDIHTILEELTATFSIQFQLEKGYIRNNFNAINKLVLIDKTHLVNVFSNLFSNSLKYSTDAPRLEVATENQEDSIIVKVRDRGIGISDQYKDKIFDKFFRVPQGNRHDVKGLGIGLYYCKHVIQYFGGEIFVRDNKIKGSCFVIKLPSIVEEKKYLSKY